MKQYEKLLYQANMIPYRLGMLFLVFNTWQTIFTLNNMDIIAVGIRTAEIVLLNILMSFLAFIVSSELKRYSLRWSWIGLGIGGFQCLRVFFIAPSITGPVRQNIAVTIVAAGLFLILAAVISIDRSKKRILAAKE